MLIKIASHELSTRYGTLDLSGYLFGDNQQIVFALSCARSRPLKAELMLRVQYGCVNGTVFGANDCDCGFQIDAALRKISKHGNGLFIYYPEHEAFGLGLAGKMKIVALEKQKRKGFLEVIRQEGLPMESSDVLWTLPHIFDDLRINKTVVLLGANKRKEKRLRELGFLLIRVEELQIDEAALTEEAVQELKASRRESS